MDAFNLSRQLLTSTGMTVAALSGVSEASRGNALNSAIAAADFAQTAMIFTVSSRLDHGKPLSVEELQGYLGGLDALRDAKLALWAGQSANCIAQPRHLFDYLFMPLNALYLFDYAEKSLKDLGSLPGIKGLPDLSRLTALQK